MAAIFAALAAVVLVAVVFLRKGKTTAADTSSGMSGNNPSGPNSTVARGAGDASGATKGAAAFAGLAGAAAAALGASSATIIGGSMYVAAQGYAGGQITGDSWGVASGAVFGTAGNVGNVGRETGMIVDKAFGGSGTGDTGTFLQVSGWAAGMAWSILGWTAGLALAVAAAFIDLFILTPISDANRLAYGQAGAQKDFHKKLNEIYAKMHDALEANGFNPATGKPWGNGWETIAVSSTDGPIGRFAIPFADGYMAITNQIAYRRWMAQKPSWQVRSYHAKWGHDRGYYVGDGYGDDLMPDNPPLPQSLTTDYYRESIFGQLPATNGQDSDAYSQRLFALDPVNGEMQRAGGRAANIELWVKWNKESHGSFVGDLVHAKSGQNDAQAFLGEVVARSDGAPLLSYAGGFFTIDGQPDHENEWTVAPPTSGPAKATQSAPPPPTYGTTNK